MKIKSKDFALEVKALEDTGSLEGYASVFGVRDSYNEVVMPGAFSDSLAKHKREGTFPMMLWQHDASEPIGIWAELSDDGKGLRAKGDLLIDQSVPQADKVYSLLKAKAVRGMSIGYREIDVTPPENGGPRKLVQLELMEVSIVSFPANTRARVEAVKAEDEIQQVKFWKRFEDWARLLRDGEPMPIKEFEDILRDAGVPKALATQIASVGYAKAIRSESEGEIEASSANAVKALREAVSGFLPT
jgi:HK97 family phage prohead protease